MMGKIIWTCLVIFFGSWFLISKYEYCTSRAHSEGFCDSWIAIGMVFPFMIWMIGMTMIGDEDAS